MVVIENNNQGVGKTPRHEANLPVVLVLGSCVKFSKSKYSTYSSLFISDSEYNVMVLLET